MTVNERHQLAAQPADTHTRRRTRTYIRHTVNSRSQLSSRTAKNKRLWVKGLAGRPHAHWISLCLESSVKLPVHTDNHAAHTIYSPFVILTLLQNLMQLEGIVALVAGDCGLKLRLLLFQIFTQHVTPHTSYTHILFLYLICMH